MGVFFFSPWDAPTSSNAVICSHNSSLHLAPREQRQEGSTGPSGGATAPSLSQVNTSFAAWKTTKWQDINVEQMDIDCKKFAKDVRSLDKEMKSWDAFVGLDNTVKNMITALRAVSELQNPAIRDRHWQQLMQATQVPCATGWGGGACCRMRGPHARRPRVGKARFMHAPPGWHAGLCAQQVPQAGLDARLSPF